MKKTPLALAFFAATALTLSAAESTQETPPAKTKRPPNIIFILADDLGYGDLSCYGQERYTTPNIDALAETGVRFTHFYSNSPVCAPARCCILTGKHTGHATIRDNGEHPGEGQAPILKSDYTIAEMLKKQGYATACIGKWGLGYVGSEGDPNNKGFDLFCGLNCQRQAHFYFPTHYWINNQKITCKGNVPNKGGPVYIHDVFLENAQNFIKAKKDQPFFLWYTATIPHASLQVEDKFLDLYKGKFPEKPFKEAHYAGQPYPRAAAAAMVTRLDDEVGKLKALVKELNIDDNTIFIFASDNGPSPEGGKDMNFFNSRGNLTGQKGSLNEGGIRIPMIFSAPKLIPGKRVCDSDFMFSDLLPTFADITGGDPGKDYDGVSFFPTLQNTPEKQKKHGPFYWEFAGYGGQVAFRRGNLKGYASNLKKSGKVVLKLYDLSKDPKELTDIAAQHPEIIKEFKREIIKNHATPHYPNFEIKAIQNLKPTIVE